MPTRPLLTIGVIGTGATSRRNAASNASDLIKGGRAKFILPVTSTHYSDAVRAMADFARANNHSYEVVVDDSTEEVPEVDDLLDEATKTHKVTKVPRKLVSLIEAAGDQGRLLLAWDDEDRECADAMELAIGKGITPLDLTQGNEPLRYDEDGPDSAASDEPGPDAVVTSYQAEEDSAEEPEEVPTTARYSPETDADEAQTALPKAGAQKVIFGTAGLVEAVLAEVRSIVREEIADLKPRPRGRPRKDGKPAGSG